MQSTDLTELEQAPDLRSVRLAVVDVETSGLSPSEHHLLQVAVVVVDGTGRELVRWASDVRPPGGLLGRVGPRHIHGITRRRLWRAPQPGPVLDHLHQLLRDAVVVGHNIAFDLAFIRQASSRAGVPMPSRPALCTLELSRSLDPERLRRHRLGDLCERYGIALDRPHDALADAQATASLLTVLLRELAVQRPADLVALVRRQEAAT